MAMTKNKRTGSKILASVHDAAASLRRVGVIDKATMREFDALCLTPVESLSPDEIRPLRAARPNFPLTAG